MLSEVKNYGTTKYLFIGKKKYKLSTFIFVISYFAYLVCSIFSQTEFENTYGSTVINAFQLLAICLVVVKFFADGTYNLRNLGLWTLIILFSLYVSYKSKNYTIVIPLAAYVFCGSNIDDRTVIKTSFIALSVMIVITVFSSVIGIIPFNYTVQDGGRLRYALGFVYTTFLANYFFHALLMWLFLKRRCPNLIESIIILLINYVIHYFTDTRAVYYLTFLLIAVCWIFKLVRRIDKSKIQYLFAATFILCAVAALSLQIFYDPEIEWMRRLNSLLNTRLYFGNKAFTEYGIPLFGQKITWVSFGATSGDYFYVDSSYMNIAVNYGSVMLVLLLAGFTFLMLRYIKANKLYCCIALAFLAVHSITDPQLFSIICNPFMVLLGSFIPLTAKPKKRSISASTGYVVNTAPPASAVKSGKKSVKKNYAYNLLYELFLLIIPIVVTPYVARVLGETGSGQYSFTYSISTYFTLFASLGFSFYAQRLVASHQGDKVRQSKDFWEIFFVRLIPVGITLIVYVILAGVGVYGAKYNYLMIILSINVIAVAFDITFFFKGNEEFGKIVLRNITIKSASIICIFLFVKDSGDLWVYALIQSGAVILSNVSLWLYLPKQLVKINFKETQPFKHLKPTIILFLPTIATSIYTSLDKTLIGLITQDDAENGNYEYAEKLVKMALTVLTSLGTVMIPRNSKKFADGDIKGVEANIYRSTQFVLFIGIPLMFGMIAVSDNLISWYLGAGYGKAANLMKILAPIIPIIGLSNVFGIQFLIPSKQDKKYTLAVIIGAGINLVLNLVLIYFLKSYGAAIATVIAETAVTGVMLIFLRKHIKFGKILLSSWKYWVAGLVMFGVLFFVFNGYEPSVLHTLYMTGCGILIYFGVLTVLKDKYVWGAYRKIGEFIDKIYRRQSSPKAISNRDLSLDVLKILACAGVVILHTLDRNSGTAAQILYYLGTVSIPLFFMVNGALLLNKEKISFKYCILKIVKIIAITLFWSTLLFLIKGIVKRDFSEWYIDIFGCFIQKGYFNIFWFFGSLILIYLILPLIHKIYKTRIFSIIMLVLLIVASVTIYEVSVARSLNGSDMLSQHVIQTFRLWTHLTYFVGGAFLYKVRKRFAGLPAVISIPLLVISLFAMTAYCFYMGTEVLSNPNAEYMYDSPVVILVVSFIFIVIGGGHKKFKSKSISVVSKATMGVYILHFNFVYPVVKYFACGTAAYVYFAPIMVFAICLLISVIVNQTKYVKKLISL